MATTYVVHTGPTWAASTPYTAGCVVDNGQATNRAYECITGGTSGNASNRPTHETTETESDGLEWTYIDTATHTNVTTVEGATDDSVGDTDTYTIKFLKQTTTAAVREEITTRGPDWTAAGSGHNATYNRTVTGHEYFDDGSGAPSQRGHDGQGNMVSCNGFYIEGEDECTYSDFRITRTSDDGMIQLSIWGDTDPVRIKRCWFEGDGSTNTPGIFAGDRSGLSVLADTCIGHNIGAGICRFRNGTTYTLSHCVSDQGGNANTFRGNYNAEISTPTVTLQNSVGIRFQNSGGDVNGGANWDTLTDVWTGDATGTDTISETNEEDVFTDADNLDYTVVASSSIDGACAGKITGVDYGFDGEAFDTAPSAGAYEAAATGGPTVPALDEGMLTGGMVPLSGGLE